MFTDNYSLRALYMNDCRGLKLCIEALEISFKAQDTCQKLYQHFLDENIEFNFFVPQWIICIYSYRFNMSFTELVWDEFLVSGIEFLLCVAIALLETVQHDLIVLPFEKLIPKLTHLSGFDENVVIIRAKLIRLPEEVITMLKQLHFGNNTLTRVRVSDQEWEERNLLKSR
jgi:hypothetical protein